MIELLVVLVAAFVVIAAAAVAGPRIGIASPLVLVLIGVVAGLLPVFSTVHIEPEWILEGVLPPLLYSSAVSMPAMNFRREFGAISGLSVLLVIGSSLVLGVFFALVIPGLEFVWGVALGAVISPTDAVATSIIRRTPTSKRVVALLDGESLLNDATALVLLRTAIVATAAAFSIWGALGTFVLSVVIAVVIGWLVGRLDLLVRKRLTDPTVNTVISFAIPFVASVPAELAHASGLVAAVVAGLVTGIRGPRDLSPQTRMSDSTNWRTVELVLSGAVFLTMGLQVRSIVVDVEHDGSGVGAAVLIAVGGLLLTVLLRAAYVGPLLLVLNRWVRHGEQLQDRLEGMAEKLGSEEGRQESFAEMNAGRRREPTEKDLDRFSRRVTKVLADIEYFRRQPLGIREGAIVVWAGMRGAVTVAAAQSLPDTTPQRSVLVLIAYAVAALSLLAQGGTIGPLVARLAPRPDPKVVEEQTNEERKNLRELLRASAEGIDEPERPEGEPTMESIAAGLAYRRAVLAAQRSALLDARDNGTFDADVLNTMLANLDAVEIAMDIRASAA